MASKRMSHVSASEFWPVVLEALLAVKLQFSRPRRTKSLARVRVSVRKGNHIALRVRVN